jgi:segregation and condensation protein A
MAEGGGQWMAADRDTVNQDELTVTVDGYEGPIDVLLDLARAQKVDLARISILDLVEQYLAFIAEHQKARLELAADYLVMAAWLVYLKSRLLLPGPPPADEPSAEDMAADLTFRLNRLEAMRRAGTALMARPRLGQDVFARGAPEPIGAVLRAEWSASLFELLKAYAFLHKRSLSTTLRIEAPDLYSPDAAIRRLETMLGRMPRWSTLQSFLPESLRGLLGRSAVASHLVAVLELCRRGRLELRQDGGCFTPLWVRAVRGR